MEFLSTGSALSVALVAVLAGMNAISIRAMLSEPVDTEVFRVSCFVVVMAVSGKSVILKEGVFFEVANFTLVKFRAVAPFNLIPESFPGRLTFLAGG